MRFSRVLFSALVFVCTALFAGNHLAFPQQVEQTRSAQRLEARLSQKADFIPGNNPPLEQLIEIARHYRIPMGIEWLDQPDQPTPTAKVNLTAAMTVREMLVAILLEAPAQQLRIQDGMLHILPVSNSPDNLLALRIPSFQVARENLPGAEAKLKVEIRRALTHNAYPNGYGGTLPEYTSGPLSTRDISLELQNLTVREILDNIVQVSNRVLWVAHFPRSRKGSATRQNEDPLVEKQLLIDYPWKLILFD